MSADVAQQSSRAHDARFAALRGRIDMRRAESTLHPLRSQPPCGFVRFRDADTRSLLTQLPGASASALSASAFNRQSTAGPGDVRSSLATRPTGAHHLLVGLSCACLSLWFVTHHACSSASRFRPLLYAHSSCGATVFHESTTTVGLVGSGVGATSATLTGAPSDYQRQWISLGRGKSPSGKV